MSNRDRLKTLPAKGFKKFCPICGDGSGRCRPDGELWRCQGDRATPVTAGWRRWGPDGDTTIWIAEATWEAEATPKTVATPDVDAIRLEDLGNAASRRVLLDGGTETHLRDAIREWAGWEAWCATHKIPVTERHEVLAARAGGRTGIPRERLAEILAEIDPPDCRPSAEIGGGEAKCWAKIKKISQKIWQKLCPDQPKTVGKIRHDYDNIYEKLSQRIRFNELLQEVELDGETWEVEAFQVDLEIDLGIETKSSERNLETIVKKNRETQFIPPHKRIFIIF
jgi:hypothetical protein